MTNKEAIKIIRNYLDDVAPLKLPSYEVKVAYNRIKLIVESFDKVKEKKNDLKILEIIKKHYDKNSLFVTMGTALSFWIDKSDPDFEKVKEWLKDDK